MEDDSYIFDKDGSLEIIPGSVASRNNLLEEVDSITTLSNESNPLS